MNETKKQKMAIQKLKDDLYKLTNLVGKSKKTSSYKLFPGETFLVTLYTVSRGPRFELPDMVIGQFPLEEAIKYLENEARYGEEEIR